jgi:predicted ribosomally synthesized peptide with nif11-like leader
MTTSQITKFLGLVNRDPGLQEQVEQLDLPGIIELADKLGLTIRAADLLRLQAEQILSMTDDELDALTGGGLHTVGQAKLNQTASTSKKRSQQRAKQQKSSQ